MSLEKDLHVSNLFLVIVTPVKNEAERIPILAKNLEKCRVPFSVSWILVDDASDDDTGEVIAGLSGFRPTTVIKTKTSGKLISGGAFKAWTEGVHYARQNLSNFTHLMKLDADVELNESYFQHIQNFMTNSKIGLVGGLLTNSSREQSIHVPGPVKLYSKSGLDALSSLPLETGYDVMDEFLLIQHGFKVSVVPEATFKVNRSIGSSQGLIHGRRRNGLVCKWTGYYFPYFILHASKYIFKKPFIVGSVAMIYGYFRAAPSPYSNELRRLHAAHQKNLLSRIAKHPFRELTSLYIRN